MNKKIMGVLGLVFVIGLVVVVSANMFIQPDGNYEVEIEVSEGWNIIAGTMPEIGILSNSDIQLSDISAMYYYSPLTKEYIRVYPNAEVTKLQQADDDIVLTSAMWIYVKKDGVLKYDTLEDYPDLGNRELISGWNFVTITPDMINVDLENYKGSCNMEKVYFFHPELQEWVSLRPASDDFETDMDGMGAIIKVTSDCTLGNGGSSDGSNPPGLPSESDCSFDEIFNPYQNKCVNKDVRCELDTDCVLFEGQTVSVTNTAGAIPFTLISADQGDIGSVIDDKVTININDKDVELIVGGEDSFIDINGYQIILESVDGESSKIMGASFEITKL